MQNLYPLKFTPLFYDKIWGGQKIKTELGKNFGDLPNCGESWEISGVPGKVSVVSNGFLTGNNLEELIEVYMGDLIGDAVYNKFGLEFPLLIKFIDANDDLSVQVHPDDRLSRERHQAYGKTEMWYVLQADPGARLNCGFNTPLDANTYLQKLEAGELTDILNFVEVKTGDVFFMPAGRVHAIGKGILLAEIQQTSDVTYRIYDYGRRNAEGNQRELHTDLALKAIDFSWQDNYRTDYKQKKNKRTKVVDCDHFKTAILEFDQPLEKDIYALDSFMICIGLEGDYEICTGESRVMAGKGETVLIPASLNHYRLIPLSKKAKILEVNI